MTVNDLIEELNKYPSDMELKATETVIEQAKLLATDYSSNF